MNSDRVTSQRKALSGSADVRDAVHAAVQDADPSSLERARSLIAGRVAADEPARESVERGAESAELLGKLGMDAETLAVALLFPLVDDGALDVAAIEKSVGIEVARLTQGALRIASLKALRKTASEILQANRLRQLLLTIAEDPRVVLVSLAHHLCALRRAGNASEQTRHTLAQETVEVFAPLANRLGVWELKQELEDLAFRYLEPDAYQRISDGLDQRHSDRQRYIAQVVAQLREELQRAGISAEIGGRPKHVYSVWNKMRQKGLDIGGVFDVLGFRILVNDVSDCYAALGVVHGLWEPILDEFDDYIAKPKANGYQSLHSAVIGPEGVTIEVQIRSFAMHRHADLGVAAHWQYKEGLPNRIAWSRGFLETGDSMSAWQRPDRALQASGFRRSHLPAHAAGSYRRSPARRHAARLRLCDSHRDRSSLPRRQGRWRDRLAYGAPRKRPTGRDPDGAARPAQPRLAQSQSRISENGVCARQGASLAQRAGS